MIDFAMFNPAWWNEKAEPEPKWCYDRGVDPDSCEWDDILEDFLANPLISEYKETVHMIAFATFLPPENAVETITRRSGVFTKAIRDNVVAVTALTIDMEDEAWSIDRFIEVYHDLEFVLATSYKHASESEHNFRHRYRAVFPLVTPLPATNIVRPDRLKHTEWTVLPFLRELFPGRDDSTFDRGRTVFFSSCPEDRVHLHRAHHNHGEWLDWRDFEKTAGEIKPRPTPKEGSVSAMKDRMAQKRGKSYSWTGVADCPFVKKSKTAEYYSTPHGHHHRALFSWMCSVAGTAKTMGRPLDEFELADLARDVHLALPCGECAKGGRLYNQEARNALRFVGS